MYRVVAMYGGKEYPLHEPNDISGELQVIEGQLLQEMGKSETLQFAIPATHPNISRLIPLVTEIRAYNGDEMIFSGRVRKDEANLYNLKTVTCEGDLSYLCDSIQRPFDMTCSLRDLLTRLLAVHNSQVEERKRFEIGQINIAGSEMEWVSDQFETTLVTIRSKMTDVFGGHLRVEYRDGKRCLDYVSDFGGINHQTIRFGENLLDLSRYRDPTKLMTALIPRGAEIETEEAEGKRYVDITSVNGGKDYIYSQEAVNTYGWIFGGQDFPDAADPEALLFKARAYLEDCLALPETLEIQAVDLSLVDVATSRLKVGWWTNVESVPHGISKKFLLAKKKTYFDSPGKDTVWLGQTLPSFVGSQNKINMEITDRVQKVAVSASREINRKIENATQLITGGKGGYFVIGLSEDGHPEETFWMDTPDKETARYIVRINQNGIGFSTTGINGPYRNAWTIDGNLVADFITTGTLLADRVRGGTLEVGGSGPAKDGRITVKDADDAVIGYWDKTGLNVLKGIISGSSIQAGGKNNEDGTIFVKDNEGKEVTKLDNSGIRVNFASLFGFEAKKEYIKLGDFIVQEGNSSGFRTLLESSDERTGMSAGDLDSGQLYLWAGYNGPDDYAFLVNEKDEVHCNDLWLQDWHRIYKNYKKNNEMVIELDMNLFTAKSLLYTIIDLYNNHNGNNKNIFILADMISNLGDRVSVLENG